MTFRTLAGLPEVWKRDSITGDGFEKGFFDVGGELPPVKENAFLWPGLFADSLPAYLQLVHALGNDLPVAYIHIDCDLYAGVSERKT